MSPTSDQPVELPPVPGEADGGGGGGDGDRGDSVCVVVGMLVCCYNVTQSLSQSVFVPDAAGWSSVSGQAGAAILTLSVPVFPCPGHYHKTILPPPPPPPLPPPPLHCTDTTHRKNKAEPSIPSHQLDINVAQVLWSGPTPTYTCYCYQYIDIINSTVYISIYHDQHVARRWRDVKEI